MQKQSELYKKLAKKYKVSKHVIEHIVRHQFTFLGKNLENPKLPSILLHRFGTFQVKDGRLDFLMISLEKKDDKESKKELKKLLNLRNERK